MCIYRINTSGTEESKQDRILYTGQPCSGVCSNKPDDQEKKC